MSSYDEGRRERQGRWEDADTRSSLSCVGFSAAILTKNWECVEKYLGGFVVREGVVGQTYGRLASPWYKQAELVVAVVAESLHFHLPRSKQSSRAGSVWEEEADDIGP